MDEFTIKRIGVSLRDSRIGPETIAFMTTSRCNMACLYCRGGRRADQIDRHQHKGQEMSTRQIFKFLDTAKKFGVKEINLGGMDGEPMIRPDILNILKKIKTCGFLGSMTTNGSFLTKKTAGFLKSIRWDILILSFDSPDPLLQERLRPLRRGGAYQFRTIEFLRRLDALQAGVRVLLNCVITRENFRQFPEVVRFANSLRSIESINVLRLLPAGLLRYQDLALGPEELKEFRDILRALEKEPKLRYVADWFDSKAGGTQTARSAPAPCFTNYYIFSLDANGDVLRCPQRPEVVSGLNVLKTPFEKLWRCEHEVYRRALASGVECFEGCCTILREQNKKIVKSLEGVR